MKDFFNNNEIVKIYLKIFFSRTTEPISTKLGTKYPLVKGIQVCSNEWSRPAERGDNWEIIKIKKLRLEAYYSSWLLKFVISRCYKSHEFAQASL